MAQDKSAEDVKAEIVAAFPPGTGELFYELLNNVANLHLIWKDYRILYGTSQERIELLNWAAGEFFGLLDDVIRHDVVMRIARLTDPARSMGHDNVSLERIVDGLNQHVEPSFVKELRVKLQELRTYCEPIRQLRNRFLAHEDMASALKYHPDPLPGISRAFIEGALKQTRDIMGHMEQKFLGSPTSHEYIISFANAERLVFVLESAREHAKRRNR